ncbi:swi5-dependent recombination DNA repair protein 1 homolog [Diadema setosum]|uniref:swi5-dependent recombination DNA repair protein 1 homolog n=1 Tax=Diadema setosum TaxID=31175 RepID=UPI003B3B2060
MDESSEIHDRTIMPSMEQPEGDAQMESSSVVKQAISVRKELQRRVAEKEDICRKLRMVKMYRAKNDLNALQELIDMWREACQSAIVRLYEKHPDPKPSLGDFISGCRLDKDLINFNDDEETFS